MAAKLMYSVACFTAYLMCIYCKLTAVRKGNVNRYTGYCKEVMCCAGPGLGKKYRLGVHDDKRLYDSTSMRKMAEEAERLRQKGLSAVELMGFHGLSPLFIHLWYLDIRTFHVLPFVHAFLQGIVKDFLKAIFAAFPKKKKAGGITDLPQRSKRPRGQQEQQQQQPQPPLQQQQQLSRQAAQRQQPHAQQQPSSRQSQQQQQGSQQQQALQQPQQQSRRQQQATRQGQRQEQQQNVNATAAAGQAGSSAAAGAAAGAAVPAPALTASPAVEEDDPAGALPAEKLVPRLQRQIMSQRTAGWKYGLHPGKNRPVR
jgi:hypothetical protein